MTLWDKYPQTVKDYYASLDEDGNATGKFATHPSLQNYLEEMAANNTPAEGGSSTSPTTASSVPQPATSTFSSLAAPSSATTPTLSTSTNNSMAQVLRFNPFTGAQEWVEEGSPITATGTTPPSTTSQPLSAGTAGGSGGAGSSTSGGFTGLTSGSNTGTSTSTGGTVTPPPPTSQVVPPPSTGGFSGLTSPPPAQVTPPPSTTQTTTTVPTGPSVGSGAYQQLLAKYQSLGGQDVNTPEGQQAFNDWSGNVTRQFGVTSWEQLPTDWANRFDPNASVPHPVGWTPATTGTGATTATVPGQNYAQNQAGNQSGQFSTAGQTNTQQNQLTGQATSQNQTGVSDTASTGTQNTTGTQASTGGGTQTNVGNTITANTATTTPNDTLGFGQLLKSQAAGVGASDTARMGTLTNLMQNGDPALQSQVDQAVRQSLTGPQATGSGESARARLGGYAAAQVGRQSAGTQLAAAQQLAGPTGLATLSTAANPFLGSTTSNVGTQGTTGTSTGTNFSNLVNNSNTISNQNSTTGTSQNTIGTTAGFSNLTGQQNEANSGTATGQSSQAATGQIPQAQQISTGGGCVLCTAAIELGLFNSLRVLRKVIDFKLRNRHFDSAARGYFFLFTPLARWLLGHRTLATALYPLARAVVYEELRVVGRKLPFKLWAFAVHWTGHFVCHLIGKLPVKGHVSDPVIESIAKKNNIWFSLS